MFFFSSTSLIDLQDNLRDFKLSYYINMILFAFIISNLSNIRTSTIFITKTDSLLGDLSYPLYLLHWPIYSAIQSIFWRLSLPNHDILILLVVMTR